jgi:hypothetical protein
LGFAGALGVDDPEEPPEDCDELLGLGVLAELGVLAGLGVLAELVELEPEAAEEPDTPLEDFADDAALVVFEVVVVVDASSTKGSTILWLCW